MLITIAATMAAGRKHYITPSPRAMLKNLQKYHDYIPSLRRYFAILQWLEREGYISRRIRYAKNAAGGVKRLASIIVLTLKGIKKLASMGVSMARAMLGRMLTFLNRKDERFPTVQDIVPNISPDQVNWDMHLSHIRNIIHILSMKGEKNYGSYKTD